jgi:hypothetical protein
MIGFATLADQVKPFKNILYLFLPWSSSVEGKITAQANKNKESILMVPSLG